MTHLSKRWKQINEKLGNGGPRPINDALRLLKECSKVKFDETVEAAINLGIRVEPRTP